MGVIQCGSFTGNTTVTIGWEPQWIMIKRTDSTGDWIVIDSMRGCAVGGIDAVLNPNLSNAESTTNDFIDFTSTGFISKNLTGSYIYTVVRRPNKPPTTGTQVFTPVAYTGTGANNTVSAGFPTDMVIQGNRTSTAAGTKFGVWDRLRGANYLITNTTAAEVAAANTIIQANPWDQMTGLKVGTTSTLTNVSGHAFVYWMFKRAPQVFDAVCYTGTGVARTVPHNLGAAPELMIVKSRNNIGSWYVFHSGLGGSATNGMYLDSNMAVLTSVAWWNTLPTPSVFGLGAIGTNTSTWTYTAYLFATKAGISKVGTYTGNGSSQTINCGFTTGARFFLCKRTDATGDWKIIDSTRGLVAGNDPTLALNSTAAEVTGTDCVDPDNSGFVVVQEATNNLNVSGATYIFLAIA